MTGCRFAYPLVTRAMYRNDWEMLEPLVLPNCLDAMRQAMEDFSVAGRRGRREWTKCGVSVCVQ